MKIKIGFLSISFALLIILAGLSPVVGSRNFEDIESNENIVIEVNRYSGKRTKTILTEVSYEEAEELEEILTNLNEALEKMMRQQFQIMKQFSMKKDFSEENIKNSIPIKNLLS